MLMLLMGHSDNVHSIRLFVVQFLDKNLFRRVVGVAFLVKATIFSGVCMLPFGESWRFYIIQEDLTEQRLATIVLELPRIEPSAFRSITEHFNQQVTHFCCIHQRSSTERIVRTRRNTRPQKNSRKCCNFGGNTNQINQLIQYQSNNERRNRKFFIDLQECSSFSITVSVLLSLICLLPGEL